MTDVIINWNKKFERDKCPFDEFVGKKHFLVKRWSNRRKTLFLELYQWSYKGAKSILSENPKYCEWAIVENWIGTVVDEPTKKELDDMFKEDSEWYIEHCTNLFNGS